LIRSSDLQLQLSFRNANRERLTTAGLYVLAACIGAVSYGWGWGHITYPASPTGETIASVGHRPYAIYFAVFMVIAAIIIATIDPGAYHRRYVRWLYLPRSRSDRLRGIQPRR
jgi:hypothetical protein